VLTSFVCFPGDEIEMQVLCGEYYPVLKYEGKTSPQLMTEGDADGGKYLWLLLKVPIFL
jgi:hypothetical protein